MPGALFRGKATCNRPAATSGSPPGSASRKNGPAETLRLPGRSTVGSPLCDEAEFLDATLTKVSSERNRHTKRRSGEGGRTASRMRAWGSEARGALFVLNIDTGGDRLKLAHPLAKVGNLDPPACRGRPRSPTLWASSSFLRSSQPFHAFSPAQPAAPVPPRTLAPSTPMVIGSITFPPGGALRFRAPARHSGC